MGASDETTLKKTTCCEQLKKRVTDKYFKKKLGLNPIHLPLHEMYMTIRILE